MATAEHTLTAQTGATPEPAARSIGNETSRRMLRFVAIFRAVVAVVLLAIALGFRNPQLLGIRDAGLFLASAASYCLFALLLLVWQWRRPVIVPRLVLVELLIDVLAIILLMYASSGVRSGLGGAFHQTAIDVRNAKAEFVLYVP